MPSLPPLLILHISVVASWLFAYIMHFAVTPLTAALFCQCLCCLHCWCCLPILSSLPIGWLLPLKFLSHYHLCPTFLHTPVTHLHVPPPSTCPLTLPQRRWNQLPIIALAQCHPWHHGLHCFSEWFITLNLPVLQCLIQTHSFRWWWLHIVYKERRETDRKTIAIRSG